jgi:hypothetical protein
LANKNKILSNVIESRIFSIRNIQVMLDYHLAALYDVETKRINEQVKRNIRRFPTNFMFQLTKTEWDYLQSQFATTNTHLLQSQSATAKRRSLPYAFSEQGVAMLSSVLNSDTAIEVSIKIINAFVEMRKIIFDNNLIHFRIDKIERKQLESEQKFDLVFKALEGKNEITDQGIYFEGQIFDSYSITSKIIRSAKKSIILVDNYIDETTLIHLTKKNTKVKVLLLTKNISNQILLDVKKANEQYPEFVLRKFDFSHDRFLIIDESKVYHLGASLKDLGKKWFAYTELNKNSVENIMVQIHKINSIEK